MAEIKVTLPSLGDEAGDHAQVSFWYAEAGEEIAAGDNLLQMLTDKATFDVPCPSGGRIKEQKAVEGDTVKVGDVLCILETSE